jgi:hypothetical protein
VIVASALPREVADAASILALFLILLTLFTSEQARRLDVELGKAELAERPRTEIQAIAGTLGLFTVAAVVGLTGLARRSIAAIHLTRLDPVLWIFVLSWFLLGGLLAWQATIVANCGRGSDGRRRRRRFLAMPAVLAVAAFDLAVLLWALLG